MAVTYATFIADYTEFSNVNQYPQVIVERYLAHAEQTFSASVYTGAALRDMIVSAATAHFSAVWSKHRRGFSRVGPQTSGTTGTEISESFSAPTYSPIDAPYVSTVYGQEVIRLKRLVWAGPLLSD